MMQRGSLLINTSRGNIIDSQALVDVCGDGKIRACLDVIPYEPPVPENELSSLPNILITPHVGWYTEEAVERLLKVTHDNIASFYAGSPQNVVTGEQGA